MTTETMSSMDAWNRQMRRFKLFGVAVLLVVLAIAGWFGYRWFLDPAGSVAWAWEQPLRGEILTTQDGMIVAQLADSVRIINPRDGLVVRQIENPLLGSGDITLLPDSFLVNTGNSVARISMQGGTLYEEAFVPPEPEDPELQKAQLDPSQVDEKLLKKLIMRQRSAPYVQALTVSTDKASVYALVNRPADPKTPDKRIQSIVALDAETGEQRWSSDWPTSIRLSNLVATSQTVGVEMSRYNEREDSYEHVFVGLRADNPEKIARVKLDQSLFSEPVVHGDTFLLRRSQYSVVGLSSGFEQLYSLNLAPNEDGVDHLIQDGMFIVQYPTVTLAYDIASGRGLWTVPVDTEYGTIVATDTHIVVVGNRTENTNLDITAQPGFDQHPDMLKDMGLDKLGSTRTIEVLVVLNRRNGETLWSKDHVRGTILADGKRLVNVVDTGMDSDLAIFKDGSGEAVITQYDIDNGRRLYQEVTKNLGVVDPVIVGDRLVAFTYDPAKDSQTGWLGGRSITGGRLTGFYLR